MESQKENKSIGQKQYLKEKLTENLPKWKTSHRCNKFYTSYKIQKERKKKQPPKHIWAHYNKTTENQRQKNLKKQWIKERFLLNEQQ